MRDVVVEFSDEEASWWLGPEDFLTLPNGVHLGEGLIMWGGITYTPCDPNVTQDIPAGRRTLSLYTP